VLRSDLPEPFDATVRRMTAKQPFERHQTADELIADLEACRLRVIADGGRVPDSRSRIIRLISLQKDQVRELELGLRRRRAFGHLLIALAAVGWLAATLLAIALGRG
jgi:hypothetical protein